MVGEGVWISFKQDSTLRLYNATTFTHMQDLDIAPAIKRNIGMLYCYIFASTHICIIHVRYVLLNIARLYTALLIERCLLICMNLLHSYMKLCMHNT